MSASANPYGNYSHSPLDNHEDDLIDPDDSTSPPSSRIHYTLTPSPPAGLDDLDDPLESRDYSDRAHLTGRIGEDPNAPSRSSRPLDETYLTNAIPGSDRPLNTIDESVWDTLSRDLRAVWTKMREVLYPKYLFGGSMLDNATTLRGAFEGFRSGGLAGAREEVRNLAGRITDTENLLAQGNMSPGLRDWDLWGPLVFCLALSLLLSFNARAEQKSVVFSGVFAMVWLGEAVVTAQIKLLGGNMYVTLSVFPLFPFRLPFAIPLPLVRLSFFGAKANNPSSFAQSICIIGYTLFPLVIAALLSALHLPTIARIPTYLVLILWSLAAGISIMGGSGVVKNRVGIAVYPLFVFYVGLGCLCFIS
jgi:hypothetical protein